MSSSPPCDDLGGDFIDRVVAEGLSLPEARHRVIEELEQRYLRRALELSAGNVTAAAKRSGIARRYFQLLKARAGRAVSTVR